MVRFVQTFNWKYRAVWGLSVLSLNNPPLTAGQGGRMQESIPRPTCDLFSGAPNDRFRGNICSEPSTGFFSYIARFPSQW